MRRQYRISAAAQDDVRLILAYIRQRSKQGAVTVGRELRHAMQAIGARPGIGHQRDDVAGESLRFWSVRSYVIVYRPGTKPVDIVRVIHGARDVGSIV